MANLKNLFVFSLGAVLIVGTANAVQAKTIYADSQPLGDGFVRSYVTLDDTSDKPSDVGVVFTPGVLSVSNSAGNVTSVQLALPSEAASTGYKHVEVKYLPPDYPPKARMNVPRFEVNFFRLSSQERDKICPNADTTGTVPKCVGQEQAIATTTPVSGVLPKGLEQPKPDSPFYAQPRYGTRYFDRQLVGIAGQNPQLLTSFYSYGFYSGKESFTELLVGKAFLEKQPNQVNTSLKVPTAYSKSGFYPTKYTVNYDATRQEHSVSLGGFTFRSATPIPQ